MTKGAERAKRVERGGGGCLAAWGCGGLWRCKGWETSGSQTPTKTGAVGGQTPSAAWAGTAQRSERGMRLMRVMTVPANRHCGWNQGTTHRGRCGAQAGAVDDGQRGMRAGKADSLDCRIVRELGGILCANGRDGRVLDARNTSGGVYPGGGVEE